MAYTINFNGVNYTLPSQSERNWATQVNTYFQALAAHTLQKTGGSFTLTAEADFGSSYGMAMAYIKSKTANPATFGYLRLSKDDKVIYRNNANTADIITGLSSSDRLQSSIVISFSADDTTDVFTATGKVPANNDRIQILTFTGVGLTISGTYYVTNVSGATFKLWTSPGGPAFADVTTAGTGTMLIPDEILTSGSTDTVINKTISGANNTLTVRAANDITGILPIANGGTGSATGFSDLSTTVSGKLDRSGGTMTGGLVLANDPVGALEAATKQYVDGVASGLNTKQAVRAATTGPVTLSTQQTIDGVALIAGDRVLVKNQASAVDNGIYIVAVGSWTRATDMDVWSEVPGAFVFVTAGTQNGTTGWVCTSAAGGTIGVNNINWTQFSGAGAYTADGQGLELVGTQFSLELDGTTLSKASPGLKVAAGGITNTEINNSAAIARSKIAGGTADHVVINDGSGNLSSEAVLATSRGGTGINSLGAGVATFLGTPSSANLRSALTDETGTGAAVFANAPTLVTPVVDDALVLNHEASVTVASASTVKVYAKSDNRLYLLDSNNVETQVGSGAAGGFVNYITNPDAESSTTGWATYADAAAATPTDGTGGSPINVTWQRNPTNPIRGNADFAFAKDGFDRRGQGVAFAFTISTVDRSKKCQISFDYNTNVANYSTGDMRVYVYDVTNATLITPNIVDIPKGTNTLTVNFDTSTSTSYRLILHVATINPAAYTVNFDNFVLNAGQVVQGPALGPFETTSSFTVLGSSSNPTFGTGTTYYRNTTREGEWAVIRYEIRQTTSSGAANGSGDYLLPLPTGLSIDYTRSGVLAADTELGFVGNGAIQGATLGARAVRAFIFNGGAYLNRVFLAMDNDAATQVAWGSSNGNTAGNTTLELSVVVRVPITEWAGSGTLNTINQNTQSPIRAGVIEAYAGSSTPAGWLLCDGTAYNQADYPQLFAAIGSTWNTCTNPLTGSTYAAPSAGQFRVPDLRGAFLRGAGGPNAAGVTTSLAGYQADTTAVNGLSASSTTTTGNTDLSHTHTQNYPNSTAGGSAFGGSDVTLNRTGFYSANITTTGASISMNHNHSASTTTTLSSSQTETRPDNVGVRFIIKAWDESFNLAGFALAGTDGSSGLYQAGRAPGYTGTVALPTGMLGEMSGSQRSGTNGFSFSSRNTTSVTASDSTLISVSLARGVYLVSFTTYLSHNDALIRRYYVYPTIGGTQFHLGSSTNLAQNTIGGITLSFPLVVTADSTVLAIVGAVASLGGVTSNISHELSTIRIA